MPLVESFVGWWKIQLVSGNGPFKTGWYLKLDAPITLNEETYVPFTIFDAFGNPQDVEAEAEGPLQLTFNGETLTWCGTAEGQPLNVFVSLAEVEPKSFIYGATVFGDPEQVGVWGGGATTAPPPPGVPQT